MYKSGANFSDRNAIKEWAENGASAEEISDHLKIEAATVARFMESFGFTAGEISGEVEEAEEVEDDEDED